MSEDDYNNKIKQIADEEKLKQSVSEFPLPFACVPWGHHVRIVQHSKNIEEALFYVGYTIREGISRDILTRVMKDDIYKKQGTVPNNISQHLTPQLAQMARYVVKGNYDFFFCFAEPQPTLYKGSARRAQSKKSRRK